jgi:hypothetical protein
MSINELMQRMGSEATEIEALAMAALLRERHGIDTKADDSPDDVTDQQFFALIPEAIARAKEGRIDFTPTPEAEKLILEEAKRTGKPKEEIVSELLKRGGTEPSPEAYRLLKGDCEDETGEFSEAFWGELVSLLAVKFLRKQ